MTYMVTVQIYIDAESIPSAMDRVDMTLDLPFEGDFFITDVEEACECGE